MARSGDQAAASGPDALPSPQAAVDDAKAAAGGGSGEAADRSERAGRRGGGAGTGNGRRGNGRPEHAWRGRVRRARGKPRPVLRVLLPYAAFAAAWFLITGPLLGADAGPALGGYEPWIFLVSSLALLYVLVRGEARARARSEETLSAALGAVPDAMAIVRLRDGALLEANEGFARFGYSRAELLGRSLGDVGLWAAGEDERVGERLRGAREVQGMEAGFRTKDGSARTVLLSARPVDGRGRRTVLVARDVTAEREADARREWQSLHDPLTGLPNRSLLIDRLHQAVARATRRDRRVGVLALNLDRFRVVNESLGHEAGDLLLAEVAERLVTCLRREDTVARQWTTVARLGGDEFTIVLEEIGSPDDARVVLDRVSETLAAPFSLSGRQLSLTAGVGVAVSPEGGELAPAEILRHAAIALRRAKEKGLGRRHVFDATVDSRAVRRFRLEGDLRGALDREEMELHFQPIVRLEAGRIVGLESLLRWKHDELGHVSPLEIVPIAEESGLIVELGRWVMTEACRRAADWNGRLPELGPLSVAVNVSARELQESGFQDAVEEVLAETGLPHGLLELEITEGLMMQSLTGLRRLKQLEVRVAIDDFGTGYSSLAYLSRLPVDAIKIDRSFVQDLAKDADAEAVGRAMVAMAVSLGLDTIAEGIETEEQLAAVRKLGCTYGQGYFFSRPLRPAEAEELLVSRPSW